MVDGYLKYKQDVFDEEMQKVAWQTSIIINCMGTLKKKVKPKDLYDPDRSEGDEDPETVKVVGSDKKAQLEEELRKIFNIQE